MLPLTTHALTRRRGPATLAFPDLTIAPGQLYLLTGPNGAGKTTLLQLIGGLLCPHGGTLTKLYQQHLHLVLLDDGLSPELTAHENLVFLSALLGNKTGRVAAALTAWGLTALAGRTVRTFSSGQRQRLSLSRLLLDHRPLWLLDEPTATLDAAGQALLKTQVRQHLENNSSVVIATHDVTPWHGIPYQTIPLGP